MRVFYAIPRLTEADRKERIAVPVRLAPGRYLDFLTVDHTLASHVWVFVGLFVFVLE